MDVDRPLNKWTAAAGIPLTQRALPARFQRLRPPLPNPPYTPSHPNHPTPSFPHQADSSLHRVYLGTADQGLLNISKVKSVIHRGDKRSLLGTGPILRKHFMPAAGVCLSVLCECFFCCCDLPTAFITACILLRPLLREHQMWNINDQAPQVASIHPSQPTDESINPSQSQTGWFPLGCPQMGLKCRSRCFPSPSSSSALSAKYPIHHLDSCSGAGSTPR